MSSTQYNLVGGLEHVRKDIFTTLTPGVVT